MNSATIVQVNLLNAEMMSFCILLVLCFLLNIKALYSDEVIYFIKVCRRTLAVSVFALITSFHEILVVTGRIPSVISLQVIELCCDALCLYLPYSTFMDGERLLFPDSVKGIWGYLRRSAMFWLCVIFIISSLFTGSVRTITEDGRRVTTGHLMYLVVTAQLIYSMLLFLGPFKNLGKRQINREYYTPFEQRLVICVAMIPSLAIVMQFFVDICSVPTGYAIGLFFILVTFQQRRSSLDHLTGLNNRNELRRYMKKVYEQSPQLLKDSYIIFADIDHFKSINDTYGHSAGDRALVRFSQMLTEAVSTCKNCFLCRYGGDEFVIFYSVKSEKMVKDLIEKFTTICKRENQMSDEKYQIEVSADYIRYKSEFKDYHTFVDEADRRMYEVKRHNHEREAKASHII